MIKKYALLVLLILPACIFAQDKKIVVSGTVYEKGSQELLPGVSIYCRNQQKGASTNNYGYYSLTIAAGEAEIVVASGGYKRFTLSKNLSKDTTLNVYLEPEVLEEVVVVAKDQEKVSETTKMSTIDVPIEQIKKIPALLGEKDVLKVIQLLPGVQKGSEGSSGLYVRGGGPDQNLIILDDAPVYNAYHLFGFFSLFNGDALKSVELTKGGFPARYGGRLSSVLEMQMKDGNKEKLTGEVGIGLISSRLTLEGPIKKNKSSFLISARRTYIDAIVYPFLKPENKAGYYFYDANAKLNFNLDEKNRIFISGYFGKDKFYANPKGNTTYREKINLNWGNATATFRWNHIFSNKVFANASAIFTDYKLGIGYKSIDNSDNSFFALDYRSGIRDLGLKYDVDIFANTNHHIKTGIVSTWHLFTPSATVVSSSYTPDNEMTVNSISTLENGIYVEDDWSIVPRLKANIGFRLSHFYAKDVNYIFPEPRLAVRYSINDELSVKFGYSLMHQYLHLLSNTGIGLPTDLWVPATNRTKPLESHQLVAGIAKDFTKQGLTLTVEGYWKNMNNVLGYKEGASFLFIGEEDKGFDWQKNVTAGKGKSYGGEILLQKKKGKWSGWIGYTLSWTILQFDSLNFGKPLYAKYDRRHDASIVLMYQLSDHISLSATWVYGTGNAITLPKSEYVALPHSIYASSQTSYFNNYFVSDYGEKNSFRMAAYHRADIGVQFTKKKKNRERIFELSVYNVYNRKNPFYYYIGYSDKDPNKRVLKQISLFPIIPSVSWTVKF